MNPPVMSWYYSKNGMQLGPVGEEELREKSRSGEVSATDLIWEEGMSDWKPLGQVEKFQGVAVATPASAPPPIGGSVPIQQPPASPVVQGAPVPNYLWQSIVVTLFCCMPFGVVAIVFASKVDGLVAQGDMAGAMAASKSAKTWVNASLITGLVIGVLWIGGSIVAGLSQ